MIRQRSRRDRVLAFVDGAYYIHGHCPGQSCVPTLASEAYISERKGFIHNIADRILSRRRYIGFGRADVSRLCSVPRENIMKYVLLIAILCVAAGAKAATPEDLHKAIVSGDVATVADALDAGMDPDMAFLPFKTPAVALAAIRGEHTILELLLAHGASPDTRGFGGVAALSMAVRSCKASASDIAALLDAGADIENAGIDGMTPLMIAVQTGRRDIAELLVAKGARLDGVNRSGDGVLNLAIYARNPAFVRASLSAGAPVDQLNVLFETRGYDAFSVSGERIGIAKCN